MKRDPKPVEYFKPQPVAPMPGRQVHFATEAKRQEHLQHVGQHKHETKF